MSHTVHPFLRQDIVGIDTEVPLLDGSRTRYVFLDNAASTPTFRKVLSCIEQFMPWYSGVHRGTGVKSLISTALFDESHEIIGRFVGADLETNCVILVKNSTEAINKLEHHFHFTSDDVLITTAMEHHSNDLPWRRRCRVVHIGIDETGHLLIDDLRSAIRQYKGKVKLVAVTGASNITGICNPIHDIARMAHEAGARIFVDAAQLIPHRPVTVLPDADPAHIDFIAFSAHKMYAPFGTGVLIGPKEFFNRGEPDIVGGGVVTAVSLEEVYWNSPPDKEEAGSPNVVGAIALAKAITILQDAGMDRIAAHETHLLEYTYRKMKQIPEVELYGPTENLKDKVGVVTFNVRGVHHALAAAIFGAEGGIGLRNGCFCAHPYVKCLLKVTPDEDRRFTDEMISGNKTNMPGLLRSSFGCYTNEDDIDSFLEVLERIARGDYRGEYILNPQAGTYSPKGYHLDLAACFSLTDRPYIQTDRIPSEAS